MQAVKKLTAGRALLRQGSHRPARMPYMVAVAGLRARACAAAVVALIALSACADKPPPILPPQEPSLCALYSSFRYSPAAAAAEAPDALDKHIANERAFHEKCLIDPSRSGGPR